MKKVLSFILAVFMIFNIYFLIPNDISAAKSITFITTEDKVISYIPDGSYDLNVIIFGTITSSNIDNMLSVLSDSYFISGDMVRFIYADVNGISKREALSFAENKAEQIVFCYGKYDETMWTLSKLEDTVYLPVIVYIDRNGKILKTMTGNTAASNIDNDICEVLNIQRDPVFSKTLTGTITGTYYSDMQNALNRVNEIRKEACKEGVINPDDPSRRLTMADYRPVKWSAILEKASRIRAPEAIIRLSHTRPNGMSCFSLCENTELYRSENLAWNYSMDMVAGLEQFYCEKTDWVNQNKGAVTGHYESLISPKYNYVGMSGFYAEGWGQYPSCLCVRLCYSEEALDESHFEDEDEVSVPIEIKKEYIESVVLNDPYSLEQPFKSGTELNLEYTVFTLMNGYAGRMIITEGVNWKSSNEDVAQVRNGVITVKNSGTAVISADFYGEYNAEYTISSISSKLKGDADNNGLITIVDATKIQQFLAKLITENEIDIESAKTSSEDLSIADASRVQQYLARIIFSI